MFHRRAPSFLTRSKLHTVALDPVPIAEVFQGPWPHFHLVPFVTPAFWQIL